MFGVEKELVERSLRGRVIDVLLVHLGMFYMYIFSFLFIFLPQPKKPPTQPIYTQKQIPQTTSFTSSSLVRFEGYLVFTEVKNQIENPRQEKENVFCHYLEGAVSPPIMSIVVAQGCR